MNNITATATANADERIVLQAKNIQKFYGQVTALADGNITLRRGEIHALLGDNGAGKSTLIKIISGAIERSGGTILLENQEVNFTMPKESRDAGIETVYQDLSLAGTLSVGENIFLGEEILLSGFLGKLGFINRKQMTKEAKDVMGSLGATIPSYTNEVGSMSGGQMQATAIARAVKWGKKVIILDEPTAALGVRQREQVLRLMENIKKDGRLAVLLITHNLPDVLRVADKATILHQGRTFLYGGSVRNLSTEDLVAYMTGARQQEAPEE